MLDIGSGPVPGEMHLSAGQEPVAVGVCAHLKKEDTVVGTHRPHHFAIAKGVPLDRMTAEMFGKAAGLGKGKGGHMHLFDPSAHFACTGIVGAGIPQAVGAALAYRKLGTGAVALAEFGEGASNQGSFHEALNMASHLEIDDVIDPAETRPWLVRVLASACAAPLPPRRGFIDAW